MGQNKKEIVCAQNQKNSRRRWSMKNHINDGVWQTAARNVEVVLKHSHLFQSMHWRMRGTMALVPSSCGKIYKSYALRRQVHNKRWNTTKYYGKACIRPQSGPTMTWRIGRWRRLLEVSHISVNTLRQCGDNDVSNVTVSALLHATSAL